MLDKRSNRQLTLSVLLLWFAILIPAGIGLFFFFYRNYRSVGSSGGITIAPVTLPVLAIYGLIGLLAVLTIVSVTFSLIGLSNNKFALGLPEGSVRAVIALGLIVVFVILSIFLFGEIKGSDVISRNVPITSLDTENENVVIISCLEKDSTDNTDDIDICTAVTRIDASQASQDFANQILTTLSTLVVAVASFYFGSRSVSIARGDDVKPEPFIGSIEPNNAKQGLKVSIKILGKNFASPKTVKIVRGAHEKDEILCKIIDSNSTEISCELEIDTKAKPGKWNLVVINEDGAKVQLDDAFEVKKE